jgi:hypothetical protein
MWGNMIIAINGGWSGVEYRGDELALSGNEYMDPISLWNEYMR